MKHRYLLLASTVLPLAMSYPAMAQQRPFAPILLAQADQPPCPEGQECPPPAEGQAPADAPAGDQPAPAQEAAPEPPPPDQPAAEQPAPQDVAPQEPAVEPAPVEPPPPAADQPAEPAPAPDAAPQEPTADQPAPDQPAVQDVAPQAPAADEATPPKKPRRQRNNQPPAQQEPTAPQPQPDQPQPEPVAPSPDQATAPQPEQVPPTGDSTVEQQLDAQGDQGEAKNVRNLRERLQQQLQNSVGISPEEGGPGAAPPTNGQDNAGNNNRNRNRNRNNNSNNGGGDRRERGSGWWSNNQNNDVVERRGGRIVIDLGNGNLSVEPVAPDEGGRLLYGADDVEVQNLPRQQTRTIVHRRNGVDIVTVRDRYGDIVKRSKILPDGTEIVLIDNRFPDDYQGGRPPVLTDVPPPVIGVPQDQYIVDYGQASENDIRRTLRAPLVQQIQRPYTLDEVLQNQDVRAYSPRIDLDSITFETGSATIGNDQMRSLFNLGQAMEQVIAENPDEVYLIEGHTDKVGSARDNLILSDQRAEAVATALSQNFEIPPENLVTKGYGEAYPKINTESAERRNRRAAIRRLTELLQAQNQ